MTKLKVPVQVGRRWYYRLSQIVIGLFFRTYFRHVTSGVENIPESRGAVIATNHVSVLDPILIGLDLPRPVYYMAKKSLHEIPLFGRLIRAYNAFPVNRRGSSRGALKMAREIVEKGNLLLIFPEGSRGNGGGLRRFKPGIGKILTETGAPVVPGFIGGAAQVWPANRWFPRPVKTKMIFGQPVNYNNFAAGENRRKRYQKVADDIQERVAELNQSEIKNSHKD